LSITYPQSFNFFSAIISIKIKQIKIYDKKTLFKPVSAIHNNKIAFFFNYAGFRSVSFNPNASFFIFQNYCEKRLIYIIYRFIINNHTSYGL